MTIYEYVGGPLDGFRKGIPAASNGSPLEAFAPYPITLHAWDMAHPKENGREVILKGRYWYHYKNGKYHYDHAHTIGSQG